MSLPLAPEQAMINQADRSTKTPRKLELHPCLALSGRTLLGSAAEVLGVSDVSASQLEPGRHALRVPTGRNYHLGLITPDLSHTQTLSSVCL